ncbi:peroxiredoxin family protein [Ancylomarina longa]|uniref:Thioredoxin domain-containing protein n=1 Tax=Ancylomarina longa TaxID=2487017 RepID=A0A434AEQ0_9BACT|nr:thioredoxin family protein [Ancylomarina longa]RUT72812.1 hypothetical protein DLK05_16595 [Ancylomarina longa]
MFRSYLLFALLLFSESIIAQSQMELHANMPAYANQSFSLLSADQGGVYIIDSTVVKSNGDLDYRWKGSTGFYRISNESEHIDMRVTSSDFSFSLKGSISDGEFRFSENDENNQYQYYLSEFNMLNNSVLDLRKELEAGIGSDSIVNEIRVELKHLQRERKILLKDLWGNHIDSWSARYVLAQQERYPDSKLTGNKAEAYYLKYFFDYFAFSDSLLVGTPVYYEKIGKYLKSSHFDELIANQSTKKIKKVIGTLYWMTELDPDSQKYMTNYLLTRYPEEKYAMVYHIVVDAYKVLNTCEYVLNSRTIQNRIYNSRSVVNGWIVPDVTLYHSLDGRVKSLSEVNSEYTLIVIWSASCVHSNELLNKINQVYYTYKDLGLEVVALSLDNNLNFWEQTVSFNNYSWINACDTDGLNGTIARQFNIYVTPSMFLIDSNMKLVAMPQTFFQLEQKLNEIL